MSACMFATFVCVFVRMSSPSCPRMSYCPMLTYTQHMSTEVNHFTRNAQGSRGHGHCMYQDNVGASLYMQMSGSPRSSRTRVKGHRSQVHEDSVDAGVSDSGCDSRNMSRCCQGFTSKSSGQCYGQCYGQYRSLGSLGDDHWPHWGSGCIT